MREPASSVRETAPTASGASRITVFTRQRLVVYGRVIGVASVMGLFLALLGAYGTGHLGIVTRLIYWVPMMLAGTVIAVIINFGMNLWIRPLLGLADRPVTDAALIIATTTPLISLTVWAWTVMFKGAQWRFEDYLEFLLPVFVVTCAMTTLSLLIARTPQQSHAFPEAEPPREIAFRERLPFKFRQSRILALSAEDHYLRVYTEIGETLILMRLYDAIRELEGIEGSQVHRSWWVAKGAVADVERRDGRVSLKLSETLSVPVSRTYARALKQDGWI